MIKFKEELLKKVKNDVDIYEYTEDELDSMIYAFCIDESAIADGKWSVHTQAVFELGDETFAIDYDKGKTEYQENDFLEKPYKVRKETEQITIEKYVRVED